MATSFFPCHQTSGECPPSLPTSFFPPCPFGSVTSFSALTIPEWCSFPPFSTRPFSTCIYFHFSPCDLFLLLSPAWWSWGLLNVHRFRAVTEAEELLQEGHRGVFSPSGAKQGHASSANLRSLGRFPSHDSIASFSVTSQGCMKQGSAW